jgi:hypothetical protein
MGAGTAGAGAWLRAVAEISQSPSKERTSRADLLTSVSYGEGGTKVPIRAGLFTCSKANGLAAFPKGLAVEPEAAVE